MKRAFWAAMGPALAKFYQTVFDMKQVNRFDMSNGNQIEIIYLEPKK